MSDEPKLEPFQKYCPKCGEPLRDLRDAAFDPAAIEKEGRCFAWNTSMFTCVTRRFPVLWQGDRSRIASLKAAGCPETIPWSFMMKYETGCLRNHEQSVRRLAERGGLAPEEIIAAVACTAGVESYEELRKLWTMPVDEAVRQLKELLKSQSI